MIIDLLNFNRHYPGTEANILFRLQEKGIRVPPFFCITKDFTEDELNNYLQNHFQHTTRFIVRLSLSFENHEGLDMSLTPKEPPLYINIPKSILVQYAERLFSEAHDFSAQYYPDEEKNKYITSYVIIQEMVYSDVFGSMETACKLGVMNETIITLGEGYDSDFEKRGVPFSIYCHNDTDGILFAHEPEGAVHCEHELLRRLINLSDILKRMFKDLTLEIKFIVEYEEKKLYLVSVRKINEFSDTKSPEIILDTKGVCNYYPGVTVPLQASAVMMLSHRIMQYMFKRIGHEDAAAPELFDPIAYVNGRLYFDTKRLYRLQEILSFHEDTEEFINRSVVQFFKHLKGKKGISGWKEKRDIALKLNKLLEDNLRQRKNICNRLKRSLEKLSSSVPDTGTAAESIYICFENAVTSLSDCLYANLLNTFYINVNRKLMSRLKPIDKKYKKTERIIETALAFRSELRSYHAGFSKLMKTYSLQAGRSLVKDGVLENEADISMLTYDEILIIKNTALPDIRERISRRKKEFEWYESMPGFTKLVFMGEKVNAPVGIVDFIDTIVPRSHIRGSGLVAGNAVFSAVVCKDGNLPDELSTEHIYVLPELPKELAKYHMGGLIVMEPCVFANLEPEVRDCGFPIVCGAEHACTVIKSGDIVDMNGASGEITISCMENIA